MAEPDTIPFPKTPGGTIDWEVVFDAPSSGFITLITQAPSPAALRECAIVIIKQLYTRKDDPAEVERFVTELTEIIPDDLPNRDLPRVTETISMILCQIKEDRIEKAATYEKEQALAQEDEEDEEDEAPKAAEEEKEKKEDEAAKAPKAAEGKIAESEETPKKRKKKRRKTERRKSGAAGPSIPNPIPSPSPSPSPKPKKNRLLLVAGLFLTVVAAGIAAFFIVQPPEAEIVQPPVEILIEEIQNAALGNAAKTHIFGGAITTSVRNTQLFVTVEDVPRAVCGDTVWGLVKKGTIAINGKISRRMSPDTVRHLCASNGEKAKIVWRPDQP